MQSPITFERSEPEPDLAVVRGSHADYKRRHPRPSEVGLLIETSDSSLALDRTDKRPIYADARIPCYWIINLVDRQVEVYSEPLPATDAAPARYAQQAMFGENDKAPLVLDGRTILEIAVRDVLP
jgi:Uma2 family endonuclease